jgi:hypothetical protein
VDPAATQPKDSLRLYAGIFFLFVPVGVLLMMGQMRPERPLGVVPGLVCGVFAGLNSVGWAYTFIRAKWWLLAPLIIAPILLQSFLFDWFGGLIGATSMSYRASMLTMALMCVASIVIGFILSVIHMRSTERRTARALADLELARQVHATLAPAITMQIPGAEVHGRSFASSTMGGDLIDAVHSGDRLIVLLGDVSGHGVAAGVVMAMLKSCIRTGLMRAAELDRIVSDANRVLADLTAPNMFATLAALRVGSGRRVEFALAGHLPIFHYHAAEKRWERHPNRSLPLGIEREERFAAGAADAGPGDLFAIFTDGLVEVQNKEGRELGLEGVAAILAENPASSLAAMHEAIMARVAAHGARLDDQSLVLMRLA